MWNVLFVALLVIEALLTFFFIRSFIKSKKANSETIGYFISILILGYIIYLIPFFYNQLVIHANDNILIGLLSCLLGAIKMFAFDYLTESMNAFIDIYPLYGVIFTIASILAMFTTVLASLSFFYVTFVNQKRLNRYLKNKNCDIVFGLSKIDIDFLNNHENKVLWSSLFLKKEVFTTLIDEGYAVINKKVSVDVLSSKMFRKDCNYHFYHLTENEDEEIQFINVFKELISKGYKNMYLHLNMYSTKVDVFNKKIKRENLSKYIDVFDIDKLIAKEVADQIPLTKHLDESFIDYNLACLRQDKSINVFILGFDDVNEELMKQLIVNNQFIIKDENGFKAYPVNYYIIDQSASIIDIQYLQEINVKKYNIESDSENYFGAFDDIANFYIYNVNPMSNEALDIIKLRSSNSNSFNYIFLSLDNKYKNTIFAETLTSELSYYKSNFHIICNSSKNDFINDFNNNKVSYYGDYKEILNKSKDKLKYYSTMIYDYNFLLSKELKMEDFSIESISSKNYESTINVLDNIKHILNVMGYGYIDIQNSQGLKTVDYIEYKDRLKRFNVSLKDIKTFVENMDVHYPTLEESILYQQHLRWCANSLVNGYKPMCKNEYYKNLKLKNELLKENIFLTNFNSIEKVKVFLGNIKDQDKDDFDISIYEAIFVYHIIDLLKNAGIAIYKLK